MTQDNGASADADQALVSDQAATRLDASRFDPSRITERLAQIEPHLLQPIIKKAADEFYCTLLDTTADYLRENLDWNLTSHLSMLERENRRMRAELWEIDKKLGQPVIGGRMEAIDKLEMTARRYSELLWGVSRKYEGEGRHETALRYIRERDSDGSGEAGQTAKQAGPKATARAGGIARTPPSEPRS